jgi:hypothetical protein
VTRTRTRTTPATVRAAGRFSDEKPLSWASRQLAESTALAALGLSPLGPGWRPAACRGIDDRRGADCHLANARLLAQEADAITIEQAIARARNAPSAPSVDLRTALTRYFALDLQLDIANAAETVLDAATRALERHVGAVGLSRNPLETLRGQAPLPERNRPGAFAMLLNDAVA